MIPGNQSRMTVIMNKSICNSSLITISIKTTIENRIAKISQISLFANPFDAWHTLDYSTVTDFARLLGKSGSYPFATARWYDRSWSGMTASTP